MRFLLSVAAAALAALAAPHEAAAYWWSGAGIGIGEVYRSLDFPTERRVPYFAAHPPVYYSVPVPRTYGYSPFAYGPEVRTPDVVPVVSQPVEILNPYVPSSAAEGRSPADQRKETKSRTISSGKGARATGPRVILNPFVAPVKSKTI